MLVSGCNLGVGPVTSNPSPPSDVAIGQVAPEIEGFDLNGQSLRLSEFRGQVVALAFWGHW